MTFTKELQDGRIATVTPTGGRCTVEINGVYFTDGELREMDQPRGSATHAIGYSKVLGLTTAEAEMVRADIARAKAEWDASDEGQRAALALTQLMAEGRWTDAREHAVDTGDWSRVGPAETALKVADDAIDAFDAAHPELAARIAAKREKREAENFEAGWSR
jgi:hypothetical protein